jgi:Tol biopolymer transport system component
LNVIGADGRGTRELYRGGPTSALYMHRWMADGAALFASEAEGDARRAFILPTDGRPRRDIARLAPGDDQFFDLSPDGQWLAIARTVGLGDRDLVVLDLGTGETTTVVGGPANVEWPIWTPDGQSIVFTTLSGSGSLLMRQPMSGGRPIGAPRLESRFGRSEVRLIAFGADGSLFAMHRPGPRTAYVAGIDLYRTAIEPSRLLDPADAENTTGADWSPDGGRIAYLRGMLGRPGGAPGTLVIRAADGGVVDEIALSAWLPESASEVQWSPDGRHLAVAYGGEPSAMAIDVIDLATRERRPVVSGVPFMRPRWNASGDSLYYQQGSRIMNHDLATGTADQAYRAEGFDIQRNAGFDVNRADGALAILATRPRVPCLVRIVEPSGAIVDRHTFNDACRAIEWSRDGARLLVSTVPGPTKGDLWILERAGGDPVRLPIEAELFHDLSLSPDGRALLYSTGNPQFKMVMLTGIGGGSR